jgi:hypothetical protein
MLLFSVLKAIGKEARRFDTCVPSSHHHISVATFDTRAAATAVLPVTREVFVGIARHHFSGIATL